MHRTPRITSAGHRYLCFKGLVRRDGIEPPLIAYQTTFLPLK